MNKQIYILKQTIYNGTVCMGTHCSAYKTRELAERVKKHLTNVNANCENLCVVKYYIEEVDLYNTAADVPCLNDNNK